VRRKGKNLWVDGPFGPVEICSIHQSISHYRGRTLKNGSVRQYLRHILAEINRILSIDSGWQRKENLSSITDPSLFYESIFRPNERERDRIRWWAGEKF
tara:strand:+ start:2722 stop:3018 length:297 start_codon:yes stop_codon:yes gene_type:complete